MSVRIPVRMLSPAVCKTWLRKSWSLKKPLTKSTLYDLELGANSHLQVDFFFFFPPFLDFVASDRVASPPCHPEAHGHPALCWPGSRAPLLTQLQGSESAGFLGMLAPDLRGGMCWRPPGPCVALAFTRSRGACSPMSSPTSLQRDRRCRAISHFFPSLSTFL